MAHSMDVGWFLQPEIRCETYIGPEMKKVWLAELQMVEIVIDICKKHGLSYQMIGGSLLGAARHQGFIPWDDDIDIGMLRYDYDKFIEIAPSELKAPFFLQTSLSDPGRNIEYAQIRNSGTAAIDLRYVDEKPTYNQGIFIDIFPIDGVGDESTLIKQEKKKTLYRKIYQNAYLTAPVGFKGKLKHIIGKTIYSLIGAKSFYHKRNDFFRKIKIDACEEVGLVSWLYGTRRNYWKKADILDCIEVPFEYLMVSIPRNYDSVLTQTYGNWRVFEKGTAMHEGLDFSTDFSYGEYLSEKYHYPKGIIPTCKTRTIPNANICLENGISLVPLGLTDEREIYDFLQTIGKDENDFRNDVYGMTYEEFHTWLIQQDRWANGKDLPKGYVPQTIYWLLINGKPVGYGKIRWGLTNASRLVGGNVGYAISGPDRGKGYGTVLFKGLLEVMRNGGVPEILATVTKPNYASKKVMEKCGGRQITENEERWFFAFDHE